MRRPVKLPLRKLLQWLGGRDDPPAKRDVLSHVSLRRGFPSWGWPSVASNRGLDPRKVKLAVRHPQRIGVSVLRVMQNQARRMVVRSDFHAAPAFHAQISR